MDTVPQVTVPEGRSGPWTVKRFTVERASLRLERRHVPPGVYTMLKHDRRGVIMSDTPDERNDHYQFVRVAEGHVLINGLGLGMCLGAVLAKPQVTRVTVVEADADVIALVAPHYEDDVRVEIVNCDAYDYVPPRNIRYGAVWHDIWDGICTSNVPEMTRLHRKYGRRAAWQGSWARYQCENPRWR